MTLRVIQPMAVWLWIGGGVIALETLRAAWPGHRRRPADPAEAPAAVGGPGPAVDVGPRPCTDDVHTLEPAAEPIGMR